MQNTGISNIDVRGSGRLAMGSWNVRVASGIIPNACPFKYMKELTKAKWVVSKVVPGVKSFPQSNSTIVDIF